MEVKEGTTTIATFEYDGEGRRTEKVAAGLTHTYVYDVEDIVEERISESTSDTIRYYHGEGVDQPLARKNSADVVTYYLADQLGSVVQETSASGAVTLEREFDPWGVALQGASTSGYGFTGREWDAETGLAFYRARYYSPLAGRFLSDDPAGLIDGPNLSTYVRNRPTGAVDPTGNNTWILQWAPAVITTVATAVTVGTAPAWVGPALVVGGVIATTVAVEMLTRPYRSDSALDDYPTNPDDWRMPDGWREETKAKEATDGRHRHFVGPDGQTRQWDREGAPHQTIKGPHWKDSRYPGKHISCTR